ncbi:MAG: hypothetical protein ACR2PZ_06635 [Pseudomonadales bacterium]
MFRHKTVVASIVITTFLGIFGLIVYLARSSIISVEEAGLLSVALIGLYVGCGILIALYRLISKLD